MVHPSEPRRPAERDAAVTTRFLAVLLLIVAGALVFTVIQQRRAAPRDRLEPRAGRPAAGRSRRRREGDDRGVPERLARRWSTSPASTLRRDRLQPRRRPRSRRAPAPGFVWDQRRPHRHQLPRRRRPADRAQVTLADGAVYAATIVGARARQGPRGAARSTRRRRSCAPIAGRHLDRPAGRPEGARDRQPVRPRPDADHRRHQRPRPRDQDASPSRPIYDVIQTDAPINPGNSRRAAARQPRPADRRQHRDLQPVGRQRRHRLRGAGRHGEPHRAADPPVQARRAPGAWASTWPAIRWPRRSTSRA